MPCATPIHKPSIRFDPSRRPAMRWKLENGRAETNLKLPVARSRSVSGSCRCVGAPWHVGDLLELMGATKSLRVLLAAGATRRGAKWLHRRRRVLCWWLVVTCRSYNR
jgi:hypothetical protein